MTSTQILKVRIVDASAKVRAGAPSDDQADMKNADLTAKTWVGVVPTWTAFGLPIASPENQVSKVPAYLSEYLNEQNEVGRRNAVTVGGGKVESKGGWMEKLHW